MDYKIDYDAEYWDVVGNRKFTCYSEEDARWLCNFLNNEEQLRVISQEEISGLDNYVSDEAIKELSSKYILIKR